MFYGNALFKLRDREGITSVKIAKILNISDSLYSRYEKEIQIIPIKHLNTLSNFYNVSIDFIFGFTEIKQYNNLKNTIDKSLSGKRIKNLRKCAKKTLIKLSDELNCAEGTIRGYEKGRYIISTPILYDLCKKFNVSSDYILGKIDKPKNIEIKK